MAPTRVRVSAVGAGRRANGAHLPGWAEDQWGGASAIVAGREWARVEKLTSDNGVEQPLAVRLPSGRGSQNRARTLHASDAPSFTAVIQHINAAIISNRPFTRYEER